jgi:hypothetical protein
MGTTMTTAADPSTAKRGKAQGGRSAKTDRLKSATAVKATIVMDQKLHCLLSSIATFQGMNGSELAVKLIDRGLKASYSDLYEALQPFNPKSSKRAKADASGDTTDRAAEGFGVSGDEAAAA